MRERDAPHRDGGERRRVAAVAGLRGGGGGDADHAEFRAPACEEEQRAFISEVAQHHGRLHGRRRCRAEHGVEHLGAAALGWLRVVNRRGAV